MGDDLLKTISNLTKKKLSPRTAPTERTPKHEYLIAPVTWGPLLGPVPSDVSWEMML